MIQANELRIGNYVFPFDDKEQLFFDCVKVSPNDFKDTQNLAPIPLTEEWLVKFGFDEISITNDNVRRWIIDGYIAVELEGNVFTFRNNRLILKSVHQLQNLYFALTGKEL